MMATGECCMHCRLVMSMLHARLLLQLRLRLVEGRAGRGGGRLQLLRAQRRARELGGRPG